MMIQDQQFPQGPESSSAIIVALFELIQAAFWPLTVLLIICCFRKRIGDLIKRITNIKYPGGEIATQVEDPNALRTNLVDYRGFYTKVGLTKLIEDSVQGDEKVVHHLPLFETYSQHTWLISTDRQLFCVLDDIKTRNHGRPIQWRMLLTEATPIRARLSKKGRHVLDVGKKKKWLYSRWLHSDPNVLEEDVRKMTS